MNKFLIIFIASTALLIFGLTDVAKAEALPDLVIDSVTFDPVQIYPIILIKNQGDASSTVQFQTYTAWLGADGQIIHGMIYGDHNGVETGDVIAPGQTKPLDAAGRNRIDFAAPDGAVKLRLSIDSRRQVNEGANENNNITIVDVPTERVPAPDLMIENISVNGREATMVIKNNDAANVATGDMRIWYEFFGIKDGYQLRMNYDAEYIDGFENELGPGGRMTVTFPYNYVHYSGSYGEASAINAQAYTRFFVYIQKNSIIERSYDNNHVEVQNWNIVPDKPDLIATSVNLDAANYPIITIENQGAPLIPADFDVMRGDRNSDGSWPRKQLFNVKMSWLRADGQPAATNSNYYHVARTRIAAGEIMVLSPSTAQHDFVADSNPVPLDAVKVRVIVDVGYYGGNIISETNKENNTKVFDLPLSSEQASADDLPYPIAELGNCQNREDCRNYCGRPENASACAEFGVARGLLTEEEAQALIDMANIEDGPGGCTTKEGCAEFCEAPANIEACLNYAEQHTWMTADELSKARKVVGVLEAGGTTPGSCNTPTTCKTYCSDNTHAVECVAFGKTAGLLTAEEAAEAEKVAPLMQSGTMPGGKTNREELEVYCESHRDECDQFFEQAGVKKGNATTTIFEEKEGGGPGGCTTKAECDAYCDAHPGECDQAVIEAGGEVKEATPLCSTKEECEVFCNDPANKEAEACKSGTIIIEEEPPESAGPTEGPGEDPLEKLRSDIQEVISQSKSQDCVKQILGEEVFTKFIVEGGIPEKAISREALQPCFEEAKRAVEQEEMLKMQKKPDDPDFGNPPPSGKLPTFLASVINILKWFGK